MNLAIDAINANSNAISELNIDMGGIALQMTSDISEFDKIDLTNTKRILLGIISNVAYVSIDVNWIRIQFKASNATSLYSRIIYGGSPVQDWKQI